MGRPSVKRAIELVREETRPFTTGSLVVGSAAYKNSPNDIDLALITDKERLPELLGQLELLATSHNSGAIQERLKYKDCAHSLKRDVEGEVCSFWVYTPDLIHQLFSSTCDRMKYVRETPNAVGTLLYDVDGRTIQRVIANELAGNGLIIATEPNFVRTEGSTYIGVSPDAFLKKPRVLSDPEGFVERSLRALWKEVYELVIGEGQKAQEIIARGELPLIKSQASFQNELREYMRFRLNQVQEGKG